MANPNCCCGLGLGLSTALFLLLKLGVDSYREGDQKKAAIGFVSSILVVLAMIGALKVFWEYPSWSLPMLIWILPLVILPVLVITIYVGMKSYDDYKEHGDLKRFGTTLAVIIVVITLITASVYVSSEYLSTPDANQEFVLSITQDGSDQVELTIPNIEGDTSYFPPERYEIVRGEGDISKKNGGEFIKITTSSEIFKIKYSEEAEMFSDYHGKWHFQFDKIEEENHTRYMNITYFSEQNTSCHLPLHWEDDYSPKIIGGHWDEVEVDEIIDDGTEKVEVRSERSVV